MRSSINYKVPLSVTGIMPLLLVCRLSTTFLLGSSNAFSFSSTLVTSPNTASSQQQHHNRWRRIRSSGNNLHHMSAAAAAVRRSSPRRQLDEIIINQQLHYLRRDDEDYISNNQGIIIDNAKRTSRYIRRERLRHQRLRQIHQNEQFQHRLFEWMEMERTGHHHHEEEQGDERFTTVTPPPPPPPPQLSQPRVGAAPPLLVNTPIPIINFRTNSDFPASELPPSHWITHALPPLPFEDAKYSNCIALRPEGQGGADEVAVESRTSILRILVPCMNENECLVDDDEDENRNRMLDLKSPSSSYSTSSVDSSSSSSCVYIHGVKYSIQTINEGEEILVPQQRTEGVTTGRIIGDDSNNNSQRAYWLQSKLHNAIYGQVRRGTVLQRLEEPIVVVLKNSTTTATIPAISNHSHEGEVIEWMAISTSVAIKQMSWDAILSQRGKLAEDPITEVAAMQYLQGFVKSQQEQQQRQEFRLPTESNKSIKQQQQQQQQQHHIMMPLELLSDDKYLYSITPFCTGGRLLDVLENKSRFSEPEARYWMRQILKGLSCLKKAGVAHRDMSPENLMVHEGNVFIIDMGMSLRIPSLQNMNDDNYYGMQHSHQYLHPPPHQRSLILPQSPCGKWYYLSPEVCLSEQPFDGPAVDLWAAGVILFIMLTGLPPWEEPRMSDENFRLMTNGHLMRLLTERRVGLSVDAMDLLQRMFWYDPADRLSLEQVCAHPWITHEKYNIPS